MKFGLIGIERSLDLCLLKRELEDRGHRAVFINIRKFPRYVTASITPMEINFKHLSLLDFDCFYLGELEIREGFFRGRFGKDIWMSLRDRYNQFLESEGDSLSFQLNLIMCLGEARPCVNRPFSLIRTRFRPSVCFLLNRSAIPTVPMVLGAAEDPEDIYASARIRVEEEVLYDVPCFPRDGLSCLSVRRKRPQEHWRTIAVKGAVPAKMVVRAEGQERAAPQPAEVTRTGQAVLNSLGLELAEIAMAPDGEGLAILDTRPFPRISGFEEITGENLAGVIADRLIAVGGQSE